MAETEASDEVPMVRGSVPVPDPTVLTTRQLQREIALSREMVELKADGVKELLESRIGGIEKSIGIVVDRLRRVVDQVREEINRLQQLHEEKFGSVQTMFVERDKRTEQLALADKTAIAAALQAQKEAVNAQ